MAKVTFAKISNLVLQNAKRNQKFLKHGNSIKDLRNFNFNKSDISIIVCGGPSLKKIDQIKVLEFKFHATTGQKKVIFQIL